MNAEKHTKLADAVRTGGKGSITSRKKKAVHADDKRPLKRKVVEEVKDETTVLNPEVIAFDDDDEDIAKDWGGWGHNHELCIESNQQERLYSEYWEVLMSNCKGGDDDDDPIQLDDEIFEDLLALKSGSLSTAIELTPPPSPKHHY